jgi:hypothetical protein
VRVVTIFAGMLAALGLAAAPAAAAGLPGSPTDLNSTSLVVRPHRIIYTGDGTGIIGGRQVRDSSGITWSSWTTQSALGTGDELENDCHPSCAGGRYTAYPTTLEMWRPRTVAGHRVFTRLTLIFTGVVPPGTPAESPRHFTFTDVHNAHGDGGGFGWGPPSAQDYCVDRHGMAPFAGCANIGALPPAGLFPATG